MICSTQRNSGSCHSTETLNGEKLLTLTLTLTLTTVDKEAFQEGFTYDLQDGGNY